MNTISLEEKYIPSGWREELFAKGSVGGVMLVFIGGEDKKELKEKARKIEKFCNTLAGNRTRKWLDIYLEDLATQIKL